MGMASHFHNCQGERGGSSQSWPQPLPCPSRELLLLSWCFPTLSAGEREDSPHLAFLCLGEGLLLPLAIRPPKLPLSAPCWLCTDIPTGLRSQDSAGGTPML